MARGMAIYEINVDCDPFYVALTPKQAVKLELALEPFGGCVQVTMLEPIDASFATIIERIGHATADLADGNLVSRLNELSKDLRHLAETER